MIPLDRLSPTPVRGRFVNPWTGERTVSQHWGPVAVQDPSQGLLVQLWTARTDDRTVLLSAPAVAESEFFVHVAEVKALTLAFDQSGNVALTITDETSASYLRWWDARVPGMVTLLLPGDATMPMVTLDEARPINAGGADVVLTYMRGGLLRYRLQREHFGVEHTPPLGEGGPAFATHLPLLHFGMTSGMRLQWQFLNTDNFAMNPAHALYYVRTHPEIGREPRENMNDASYRAAADTLYDEGFGINTSYDPSAESLEEFEQRICRLIGGSVSRSLTDGQYYLDLARGGYRRDDLPVVTDDDIISFSALPSTLDSAINSIAVKYFDPCRKEDVITPAVQALSLIDTFGVIHQTMACPEIPDGGLALIVAEREVRTTATPKVSFDLVCVPDSMRDIRPNKPFRLRAPKNGVPDMVCLLGEKGSGTLKSGAMRVTATQDIYDMPRTTFAEIEPGIDTTPDPTPHPIIFQAAVEAPYIELVQRLDRANLDVLPADAGYLLAVAEQPPEGGRNYSLAVATGGGGDYQVSATGDWCPIAVVDGDPGVDSIGPGVTLIPIAEITRESQIVIGSAALWDDEIVRVDAIDVDAGTMTVGRGCADTVAVEHAAGSRIWAYDEAAGSDLVEYSDGETVAIKLLTNTGTAQLDPAAATAMPLEFLGRAARPYPPAGVTINGLAWPAEIEGAVNLAWVHRDRLAQADQLFDQTVASIGPEPGVTYTVRWYLDGALAHSETDITGSTASYTPAAAGALRIEIESVRDGLASLQCYRHTMGFTPGP